MTRRTAAALLTAILAAGCGPPLQLEDEIAEVEQRLEGLIPDDWEQVDEPVTNGIGCVFDDCVRLSVVYRPSSAISDDCEELAQLLTDVDVDASVEVSSDGPRCRVDGQDGGSWRSPGWRVTLWRETTTGGCVIVQANARLLDPD